MELIPEIVNGSVFTISTILDVRLGFKYAPVVLNERQIQNPVEHLSCCKNTKQLKASMFVLSSTLNVKCIVKVLNYWRLKKTILAVVIKTFEKYL